MDDKTILLTTLAQGGFGIKPTKQDLILRLVKNYGIEKSVAEQLMFTCLRERLIDINMVDRLGITQKGLDWLQNIETAEEETAHQPDETAKPKKPSAWTAIERLGWIAGIIGTAVAIYALFFQHT